MLVRDRRGLERFPELTDVEGATGVGGSAAVEGKARTSVVVAGVCMSTRPEAARADGSTVAWGGSGALSTRLWLVRTDGGGERSVRRGDKPFSLKFAAGGGTATMGSIAANAGSSMPTALPISPSSRGLVVAAVEAISCR